MKKILLILTAIAISNSLISSDSVKKFSANVFVSEILPKQNYNEKIAGETRISVDKYKGFMGSPYFEDEFKTGTIFLKNGIEIYDAKLRLNYYEDLVEFKVDNVIYSVNKPELTKYIEIDGVKFIYTSFTDSHSDEGFMQVVEYGNCSLLLRYNCSLNEVQYNANMGGEKSYLRFSTYKNYYLKIGKNEAVKLKRKKSEIIELLSDKQTEIESYIKDNKISIKKEKEFAELIKYYNSI